MRLEALRVEAEHEETIGATRVGGQGGFELQFGQRDVDRRRKRRERGDEPQLTVGGAQLEWYRSVLADHHRVGRTFDDVAAR